MDDAKESGSVPSGEEMSKSKWTALLSAIRDGNCILMLGPDASTVDGNGELRPLTEILAKELAEEISPDIKSHIDPSNLAQVSQYYCKEYGKPDICKQVNKFYQGKQGAISSLYKNLAALPFYFTITTTHDRIFYKALENQNKYPHEGWYNFNKKQQDDPDMGNSKNPLVFYLYGHLDEEDSLLLTESDLLDFLKILISGRPGLQDNICTELQGKNKIFLFLGFGFRHWYLRLLLHVLRECQENSRSFALEQFIPASSSEFQKTAFFFRQSDHKIHIFKKNFQEFAGELRQRYEEFVLTYKPREMPKVFICHAHENKEFAKKFYVKLKEAGFNPWLDDEHIEPAAKWEKCILEAINDVDYFIVLLSESLNNGIQRYAYHEIDLALARTKEFKTETCFIIPVMIEKCSVLERLKYLNAIKLIEENDFASLFKFIKRNFAKRSR